MLCSLLNDWNCFWNKYCNLPFLVICFSLIPLLIFLALIWYLKAKIGQRMSLRYKKMINYQIKGLYKRICYKTTFLSFSFLIDYCISVFFSFFSRYFEKLIRFHWQAYIVYKNRENLKILTEIFCQNFIVSNVISVFLEHLKPKIFFFSQPW